MIKIQVNYRNTIEKIILHAIYFGIDTKEKLMTVYDFLYENDIFLAIVALENKGFIVCNFATMVFSYSKQLTDIVEFQQKTQECTMDTTNLPMILGVSWNKDRTLKNEDIRDLREFYKNIFGYYFSPKFIENINLIIE